MQARRARRSGLGPRELAATAFGLLAVLAAPSLLCGAAAQAITVIKGSEGCQGKVPGTPTNVQAVAKDTRILLSWSPPADGSCVDTYVVNTLDPSQRSSSALFRSTSTDSNSTTIEGLTNGSTYTITVQAYSNTYRAGASTNITATPTDRCILTTPGAPINLRVTALSGAAEVCWDGVDNDACVDTYKVSAQRVDSAFREALGDNPISRGGCANVSGLANDVNYKFTVVAVSNTYGEGKAASQTAYVGGTSSTATKNGWTCKQMSGCRPSTITTCSITSCTAVSRLGGCKGPGMYDLNYLSKQVTQWCSESCSCDVSVAQVYNPFTWGVAVLSSAAGTALGNTVLSSMGLGSLATTSSSPPSYTSSASSPSSSALSSIMTALGSTKAGTAAVTAGMVGASLAGSVVQTAVDSGAIGEAMGQMAAQVTSKVVTNMVNQAVSNAYDVISGRLVSAAEAATGGK